VKYAFLTILFLLSLSAAAQNSKDSLWSIWTEQSESDTNRLKAIKTFTWENYLFSNPDSAIYFAKLQQVYAKNANEIKHEAIALNTIAIAQYFLRDYDEALFNYVEAIEKFKEIKNQKGIANALNNIGLIFLDKGEFEKAISYYTQSLKITEEIGDLKGAAGSYGNIGVILQEQGDYSKSIEYHSECLKINEELGNKQGIANCFGNISVIYEDIHDYRNAMINMDKALLIFQEINDQNGEANSLNSLGNLLSEKGSRDSAMLYYEQALTIRRKLKDVDGIAKSMGNIGTVLRKEGKLDSALSKYQEGLRLYESISDRPGITSALINVGKVYLARKQYGKSIEANEKAFALAQDIGLTRQIKIISKALYLNYKAIGQTEKALTMHELHLTTRDTLESDLNRNYVIRQEFKYAYEKQAAADSALIAERAKIQKAELATKDAEKESEVLQKYISYGGLSIVLLFGLFILNRFRVTRRQRNTIVEQKAKVDLAYDELEEKNKEILDSIIYAKRIQQAILPPKKHVKRCLPNSFILYKPKDIVAGDFYWLEEKDGLILFAAADCTGHGVPGAMVSVICNNGLNRAVREHGITDPGSILDKAREIVLEEFEKSDEDVTDGMDIALCSLEGKKVKYAGANNPLWLIRNGEIIELKGDKQPIGKYDHQEPFTTYDMDLLEGDSIYIFSDGYSDQFGGEKGKKLKTVNFKRLLLSMQSEPMEKQGDMLDKAFEEWRGDLEQIDDVCVIGVRIA